MKKCGGNTVLLIQSMDFLSFGAVTAGFCAEEAEKPVMKCKVIQGHCPETLASIGYTGFSLSPSAL